MPKSRLCLVLADEAASASLGAALADALPAMTAQIEARGLHLSLHGELGTGKTTLVRALLRRAGISGPVKSPSFAILEPYEDSRLHFYHFDFYRFKTSREFADGGFGEYFAPGAVCLVEWPERAGEFLPPADLRVALRMLDAGRAAEIGAHTGSGEQWLDLLKTSCKLPGAGN